jgi:phage shock protein A
VLAEVVKRNAELEEELRALRAGYEDLEKKLGDSERNCDYLEYQLEKLKCAVPAFPR